MTLKGRTAIELIRRAGVDLLTSPEMTGQWERRLYQISKGEAGQDKFMENVKKFTLSIIEKVRVQAPAPQMLLEKIHGQAERRQPETGGNTRRRQAASGEFNCKNFPSELQHLHREAAVGNLAIKYSPVL